MTAIMQKVVATCNKARREDCIGKHFRCRLNLSTTPFDKQPYRLISHISVLGYCDLSLANDTSSAPIIAMTANVLKEEVDRCCEAGMDDFIGKPFEVELLLQKLYVLSKNT